MSQDEGHTDAIATAEAQVQSPVCLVCGDDLDNSSAIPSCEHAACTKCTTAWLSEQIASRRAWLHCVSENCKVPLSDEFSKRFLSESSWHQLERSRLLAGMATNADIRHCPNAGCSFAGFSPSSHCHSFRCETCNSCWSDKESTAWRLEWPWVYVARKAKHCGANMLSVVWKRRNTKRCPQCKVHIHKDGGCPHMKCVNCLHQFCWQCRRPWHTHASCPVQNFKTALLATTLVVLTLAFSGWLSWQFEWCAFVFGWLLRLCLSVSVVGAATVFARWNEKKFSSTVALLLGDGCFLTVCALSWLFIAVSRPVLFMSLALTVGVHIVGYGYLYLPDLVRYCKDVFRTWTASVESSLSVSAVMLRLSRSN
eukprot:GILK01007179.1.p1 GENE.GILK01007179.1~~GILK01007179.1.p1  ORF type:complete len:367 (-),score=12.26 GILK01007179.1:38-1138(-)